MPKPEVKAAITAAILAYLHEKGKPLAQADQPSKWKLAGRRQGLRLEPIIREPKGRRWRL